ncbi:MAG: hypothetical protein NVSMB38_42300 [Ktedonobacteraceae bacterium]
MVRKAADRLSSAGPHLVIRFQVVGHRAEMVDAIAQGDESIARLAIETHLQESTLILVSAMEETVQQSPA